ncbi:MAG: exopolyphosphatase [Lentisphaeria bacterium]|nr:exopolyphosphatase [Lentisphaeria bacterium]
MAKKNVKNKVRRGRVNPVAVIEVGSTSVRMIIGQVDDRHQFHILDKPEQNIALGADVFRTGAISGETTAECIRALTAFKALLAENGVTGHPASLLVVATNAVREATNREAFLDRVFVATGLEIRVLDAQDTGRCTFLSILPYIDHKPFGDKGAVLCVEMGAGGTDVLAVDKGRVKFFQSHHFGAMRLVQQDEGLGLESVQFREVMDTQVGRMVEQVLSPLQSVKKRFDLLLEGGLIRETMRALRKTWPADGLLAVPTVELDEFLHYVLSSTPDQMVQHFNFSYQVAETLAPALMAYTALAHLLNRKTVLVTNQGMREGLLAELVGRSANYKVFHDQVIDAALALGRHYRFDEQHARLIADLAMQTARALAPRHAFSRSSLLVLHVAALLHEIGLYVSNRSHHLHSQYLIQNSDLFGLSESEKSLAACVARYHRHLRPAMSDPEFSRLDREERIQAAKLIAILRVADCFDRTHSQRVEKVEIEMTETSLVFRIPKVRDLSLERLAVTHKGAFFTELFGLEVVLKN